MSEAASVGSLGWSAKEQADRSDCNARDFTVDGDGMVGIGQCLSIETAIRIRPENGFMVDE